MGLALVHLSTQGQIVDLRTGLAAVRPGAMLAEKDLGLNCAPVLVALMRVAITLMRTLEFLVSLRRGSCAPVLGKDDTEESERRSEGCSHPTQLMSVPLSENLE
jgi:hypothetical protein